MTPAFRLGFMLRIPNMDEQGGSNLNRLYADALDLAVAADQLGFDSLWVTQHHFGSVDSASPSPLVFLAAVAARTKSIRLGTTVITASLEHPIRLAEDAATLDVISGGRVELGLGTSSSALEREAFQVPAEGQRDLLHRNVLQMVDAFEGREMHGVAGAVVQPQRPQLAQRIWMATSTRAHAAFAACNGFGLITNYRPSELVSENVGYLADYCDRSRRLDSVPRVGLSRGIFPAADTATAHRMLLPHAVRYAERGKRFGWLPSSFTPEDLFDREDFHCGHPHEVIARLRNDPGLPYTTELLTGMLSARMSPRELIPVMERIALQVAPAFGWQSRAAVAC